uniref:Zinc finger HIT domain-containing protein 3 n=1 Tax=Ciona savignyi TaxID=51511 RepID=H2Y5T3_CIOSA
TKNMTVKPRCQVCNENPHKYKCPQCYKLYCSVNCYKKHKAEDSCSHFKHDERPKTMESPPKSEIYEETEQISKEVLERLKDSEKLKNLLSNPHLRRLLTEIDQTPNNSKMINDLMQEPIFVEFADSCLDTI